MKDPIILVIMPPLNKIKNNFTSSADFSYFKKLCEEFPSALLDSHSANCATDGFLLLGAGRSALREGEKLSDTLGEYISAAGLKQLRIYGDIMRDEVTFFFSGLSNEQFPDELDEVVLSQIEFECSLSSQGVPPDPSILASQIAADITKATLKALKRGGVDFMLVCYPPGADRENNEGLSSISARIKEDGGMALICSSHGNIIPVTVIGASVTLRSGSIIDIAPTVLDLMGLSIPINMTGRSLII